MAFIPNEAALPRAITVRSSVADMRVRRGPQVPHYNFPLDRGEAFRFVVDNAEADNGVTVVAPSNSGADGRWKRVRRPDKGADLTDTPAQTVEVSGDFWRVLPDIPITQNLVVTLGVTAAEAGDLVTITRLDAAAFTVTINNGGPAAGTLATFPISQQAFGDFYFDGTDWVKRRAATMI